MLADGLAKSSLFGVILYTDAHPNLKKALRDEDYWQALDEVSGPHWTVLSCRAASGRWGTPEFPPGTMGMMRMVWKEPRENRELLEAFELEDTSVLPALVLFAEDSGGALLHTVLRLNDKSPEAALDSLRGTLAEVSMAIREIPAEELLEPGRVFQAVERALRRANYWRRLRSGYGLLKEVRDWLPL